MTKGIIVINLIHSMSQFVRKTAPGQTQTGQPLKLGLSDLRNKACADPEGGTGGPDPPWNLKKLPKKR